jgi:hypothetical protein
MIVCDLCLIVIFSGFYWLCGQQNFRRPEREGAQEAGQIQSKGGQEGIQEELNDRQEGFTRASGSESVV